MSRNTLSKLVFVLSISMNLAVFAAVGIHWMRGGCSRCDRSCVPGHEEVSPSLSAQQEAQFRKLRSDFHAYRDSCHQRMMELRRELLTELLADPPDQERIDTLLDQMSAQQAQLQERLVQHLLAERAVLRPDQRPAFEQTLRRHVLGPASDADAEACPESKLDGAR